MRLSGRVANAVRETLSPCRPTPQLDLPFYDKTKRSDSAGFGAKQESSARQAPAAKQEAPQTVAPPTACPFTLPRDQSPGFRAEPC